LSIKKFSLQLIFTLVKYADGFNDENYEIVFKKTEGKKLVF
jgi:hypothetical protein